MRYGGALPHETPGGMSLVLNDRERGVGHRTSRHCDVGLMRCSRIGNDQGFGVWGVEGGTMLVEDEKRGKSAMLWLSYA